MQSLARIAVINGRPTLAAEAQRALILAAGHDLWVEESTITRCVICGRRRDSEQTSRITWTLDDAKRAGIAGKESWRRYPRQMLLARASAELARAVFADAIGGLVSTEELEEGGELVPPEGPPPTPPPTVRRQRASISAPETTTIIDAPPERERPPLPGEEDDPQPADDASQPISDAQRRMLFAAIRERGGTEADLRALIQALTGNESTAFERHHMEAVLAAIESWDPKAEPLLDPEPPTLLDDPPARGAYSDDG